MVSSGPGNFLQEDSSVNLYVSAESASRTVFLADLPRNTSYLDLSSYFEKEVGPCVISIKRPLFKQFYFAFVQFQTVEHAKKVLEEIRYPEVKGRKCRALPYYRPTQPGTSVAPGAADSQQKKEKNF